jgi:hypothetical protein
VDWSESSKYEYPIILGLEGVCELQGGYCTWRECKDEARRLSEIISVNRRGGVQLKPKRVSWKEHTHVYTDDPVEEERLLEEKELTDDLDDQRRSVAILL